MRRLILALLLLLPLLAVPCSGAEVPSFPQVDELLEEAEGYGVEGTDGLEAGARSILSAAGAQLDGLIRRSLRRRGPAWRAGPAGSRRWRWPGPWRSPP